MTDAHDPAAGTPDLSDFLAPAKADRQQDPGDMTPGAGPGAAHPAKNGGDDGEKGGESLLTVLVALGANVLIAIAKTVAAIITASASMVAEAAHSWADSGNEVFLLVAEKRSERPADAQHPLGYGRAAYVWSLVAAFGLFTAGSILSIYNGVEALMAGEEEVPSYTIAYIVLAVSFVLEGTSFLQAVRQTRGAAAATGLHPFRFVLDTSETTLRAVFFEDAAALIGLILAGAGVFLHQVTGDAVYDAVGSILVGALLGVVAVILIWRNMQFLVGQSASPAVRKRAMEALLANPEIDRVTFLHMEYVGPSKLFLVAAVDLTNDDVESVVAERLQALEDRLERAPLIARAILTLSAPGREPLQGITADQAAQHGSSAALGPQA